MSVDVKRLYLFVRDFAFCQRADSVMAFVRQSLSSPAAVDATLGHGNALLLCAETHTHAAPLLLLSEAQANHLASLTDDTVALISGGGVRHALPELRLRADSELVVLAGAYRIVLSLDVSPSVASIDSETNEVLFDALLRALERCCFALLDAFRLDGGDFVLEFRPRLYLSVVAQMGLPDTFWPLLQCALLTSRSVVGLLLTVRRRLDRTESRAATRAQRTVYRGSAGADLAAVLQNAAFVLKLMPERARSLLVLICDGAISLPDTSAYDNLLMLLNREAIACSSVQIGAGFAPSGAFGYVPDCDVLRHLAVTTHGCFFTARRLAAVCNRQTHAAYDAYVRRTYSNDPNCSNHIDLDHASHYGSGVTLQRWRGETTAMPDDQLPSDTAASTVASVSGVPGNLLQQRMLWNGFSPARRYFAYNDAYRRNGDGAGSQLDGPLLAALPRHPLYFEMLPESSVPLLPPPRSRAVSRPPSVPISFAQSRTFLPIDDSNAHHKDNEDDVDNSISATPPTNMACPLFGTSSIDAEIVVPSSAGLNRLIAVNQPFPWCDPSAPVPLLREPLRVYELNCSVAAVADVRLREGFLVDDMERANRLTLLLPWVANVIIGYSVIAKKEADIYTAPVRINLSLYACDEFLNEFAFMRSNPDSAAAPTHVHRLHAFIAELLQTDRLLQLLHTRIGTGPSVASVAPTSKEQVRSLVLTDAAAGSRRRVARALWRTLASLASMSWHRWLRIERIDICLTPSLTALRPADYSPFAAHASATATPTHDLFTLVSSLNVDYVRANEVLMKHCARWATFVHSPRLFARFVSSDGSAIDAAAVSAAASDARQLFASRSFCVLRLVADTDCSGVLSAQFAMYGVTPAGRQRIVSEFESQLRELAAEHTDACGASIAIGDGEASVVALVPARAPLVSTSRRAIAPLLVRYAPRVVHHHAAVHPLATLCPTVPLLDAHMHWRRRVWRVRNPFLRALLVDTLVHERLRDGMQLAGAGNGVFTLTRALSMCVERRRDIGAAGESLATLPAMLQYVVYAAAPDLVVTELWLEPQHGALLGGSAAQGRTAGVHLFNDIERVLYDADRELVWSLVTFDVVMLTIQSGHLSRAEQVSFLENQTLQSPQGLALEPTPVSLGALVRCAACNVVEYESLRLPPNSLDNESVQPPSLSQLRRLIERHERGELRDVASAAPVRHVTSTQSEKAPARNQKLAASMSVATGMKRDLLRSVSMRPTTAAPTTALLAAKNQSSAQSDAVAVDPASWSLKMLRATFHRLLFQTAVARNLVLWGAFGQFVSFASDCEIPRASIGLQHASKELAPFDGARCFAKRVGSTTVMIAFLARLPDAQLDATSLTLDGARMSPLRLHAFECARDQLIVSHMLTPPSLPFLPAGAGVGISPASAAPTQVSAEGELFLRNLAVGYERCFARAVYTQLRRGHAMGVDDVARTLRVCGGFASDIDITQYLRVQRMHFLSLQRANRRRGSLLQEQPDGFPAHDEDDDADEDEDASVSSTGSEQLAAPDEAVRPQAQRRVDEARSQFRNAVLEHFVPLSELVLPTSEAADLAQFADVWVYAPDAAQRRNPRRARSAPLNGDDFDDRASPVSAPSPLANRATRATTSAGAAASAVAATDDDDEDGAAGDVLDSEWAADVNDETDETEDARAEAAVHVDRQSASGAWPMPLFLRIERVVVAKKEERTSVRPITDVPTALDEDMMAHASDTVSLRFVALTLPPYEPLMPVRSESPPVPEAPSERQTWRALPKSMQAALKLFMANIEAFLSTQILDTLRYRRPMSSAILDLVQFHMARVGRNLIEFSVPLHFVSPDGLAMFPSQLTSTFYLSLRKFGDVYCVVEPRIDEAQTGEAAPAAVPPREPTTPSPPPLAETLSARTSLQSVQRKARSHISPFQVMGRHHHVVPMSPLIGVVAPPHSPHSPPPAVRAPLDENAAFHIPFWLLMRITEQEVRFMFVGPDSLNNVDRSRFCTDLRAGARRVCERVNQLYLLSQVHETRTSSNLQILSVDKREIRRAHRRAAAAAVADGGEHEPAAALSSKRNVFFPGQFVCAQVYAIHLPLHQRLAPDMAMRALVEAALHPFSVTNRKNVFVYREQNGHVFYLELSERVVSVRRRRAARPTSANSSAAPSRPATPTSSAIPNAPSDDDLTRRASHPAPPQAPPLYESSDDETGDELEESDVVSIGIPASDGVAAASMTPPLDASEGTTASHQHSLVLRVFGIDQPTAEITHQMRELLQLKLAEITLKLMSSLLLRNPNLRLATDDVQFLLGVDPHRKQQQVEAPAQAEVQRVPYRARIAVPSAVGNMGLWLAFVRAHLHRHFLVTANASRAAFESKRRTAAAVAAAAAAEPVATGPAAALMAAIEPLSPPPAPTPPPTPSVVGAVSLQQLTQPMLFNHVQTPGSVRVTHRTRAYGDGIAVLFVRVRDDDGRLVTRVERSEREQRIAANVFDTDAPLSADEVRAAVDGVLEQVRVELDTNAEAASDDWDDDSNATTHRCSATCERHWLCFDIWQRGHVNTEALVRGVVDHVRRALNAFVLETYLLCARPRVCSPFWVRSVQRLTLHAVDLGSEAFTDVDLPLALATHAVVPFARDVAARIPDIVPALQSTIYRMPGVAAGGAPLDELQPLRALDPLELGRWRAEPWRDANEAPRLLVATMLAERGVLVGNAPVDEPMMYDSVKLTAVDANAAVQQFHRRPFVMACVSRDRIRIVTYNWRVDRNVALREAVGAMARWVGVRRTALDSILLQKMGLTHAIRSELLADQVDIDAPVPTLEPMLFGSAPPLAQIAVSAPPSLPSFDAVAQSDKGDGAVAPSAGAGAADGATPATAATPAAGDEKKAPVADSTINDLIAIGGNVVRRVSSRHDMVAAAMAARRRGIAFGPSRGGGAASGASSSTPATPTANAGATGASGASDSPQPEPSAAGASSGAVATSSAAAASAASAAATAPTATASNERTGLAALLFHELLQQEELLGVAIPPMLMSTLIDPVQRHGSQFLKLATVAGQRRDAVRDTLRVLLRLNRVGQGDRLSRADLQKLLRTSRLLECASVSTPSAPPHASLVLRSAAAAAAVDKSVVEVPSEALAANVTSWTDVTRANVTSDEVTLLAYVIAQSAAPDVGWATTQANRIADLVTKLLTDRNGLRVLTLMSKTQSETQMGVANVASERWLARSYGKRAAFLVHLTWTASSIAMQTHLVEALLHLPTRTGGDQSTTPASAASSAATATTSPAPTLDDSAQINAQAFLRGTVWDFAVHELRDMLEARDRAVQPCMPAAEFVRVLQQHLDAAALRGVPRVLSVDGAAQPIVVWSLMSRFRGPAPPASARSVVLARVCPIVEGQVSAEDLLGYLSRRVVPEATPLQQVRSLVPLGVGNAVVLHGMLSEKTVAQLPSTYEFNVVAATVAPRPDDPAGTAARLALVLLCTPRVSGELGVGADLSSTRLGASRRELSLPDACTNCLNDAQERLQSLLQSAAADYRCDRLWSLMIEPQPRREAVSGQPAPLTFADFVDVGKMLHTVDVAPLLSASNSGVLESASQPRSLLRLSGAELVEQLLRSPVMQPWRDVMVMASLRFGTVRKDGTVRRATIFLADEPQPQLVVFDTACPTSVVLLMAGAPRPLCGARGTDDGAPDLASALAQQRTVIDGARLCICHRTATDAPLDAAEVQLANDFVQFLLACMWFRLAGRSLEGIQTPSSSTASASSSTTSIAASASTTTTSKTS